jgi:hypothetical protein
MGTRYSVSDIEYRVSGIRNQELSIEYWVSGIGYPYFYFELKQFAK